MRRSNTPSHTVEMRMYPNEEIKSILEARFNVVHHISNVMVKHAKGCIDQLERNKRYRALKSNKNKTKEEFKELETLYIAYGLSEFQFHEYANTQKHLYEKDHMVIHVVQKIASRVWKSAEDYLKGDGEEIHFKKRKDIHSFEGKDDSGIYYRNGYLYNKGLKIPCRYRYNDAYIEKSLRGRVKYCRIIRRWHKRRYRYYVQLVIEGYPPKKRKYSNSNEAVGIDIGPSSIAVSAPNGCILQELASDVNEIEKELRRLSRKADRQRRSNNPQNYNPDKTIKKDTKNFKKKWIISKGNKKTYNQIKHLYQKRHNQLKNSHNALANRIIEECGTDIIVEDMNWAALAKKTKEAKKTEDGKNKSRKRFGKSIANHAPSMLISLIDQKLSYIQKKVTKADCFKTAATQFDHMTGELVKHELKKRKIKVGEDMLQRDLHSAFNLQHIIITRVPIKGKKNKYEEHYSYDIEKMFIDYPNFKQHHDKCIQELINKKQEGIKIPSCMI